VAYDLAVHVESVPDNCLHVPHLSLNVHVVIGTRPARSGRHR
jgi:hypothetical protein